MKESPRNPKAERRTMKKPSLKQVKEWAWEGYCLATDGCRVEPDGVCVHGAESWLLKLGLI